MELTREATIQKSVLDIGCGRKKTPGSIGIDIHAYPGVDHVVDVNVCPWPLAPSSFSNIVCQHVIEHVENVTAFMREIHRVAKPGAIVRIETPHFSSINSWSDPTHKSHFSSEWYKSFLPGEYLAEQAGAFELVQSTVTFGKSPRNRIGSLIVRLSGLKKWEKNAAFSYPGMDIITELRVVK